MIENVVSNETSVHPLLGSSKPAPIKELGRDHIGHILKYLEPTHYANFRCASSFFL